jgi:hypothetical protein
VLLIALIGGLMFTPATPAKNKGCTPAQTRALIVRFTNAVNRGDTRTLNTVWDSKAWFKWFSVSSPPDARTNADAFNRATLIPYFVKRHAAHERWVLTSVKINGRSNGYQNFEYTLTRSADDLPGSPAAYSGKGASSCVTGRLDVWAMAAKR